MCITLHATCTRCTMYIAVHIVHENSANTRDTYSCSITQHIDRHFMLMYSRFVVISAFPSFVRSFSFSILFGAFFSFVCSFRASRQPCCSLTIAYSTGTQHNHFTHFGHAVLSFIMSQNFKLNSLFDAISIE